MRFCLNTDCLGYMPFEEMLDTVAALGYESIEIGLRQLVQGTAH